MIVVSFNANGIRSSARKGFFDWLLNNDIDILCIQETKAHPDQVDELLQEYEHHFWNSADKKGYSGTAVFSKIKPLNVSYGGNIKEGDTEGRIITLEFDTFYLVNVYTMNAQRGLARIESRKKWDNKFLKYLTELEKTKPVVTCGDFNVAHKEIDLARPKQNMKNAGFSPQERAGFDKYITNGFIDTFRLFNEKPEQYSWWSYRFNARKKNIGWRIDYFLTSGKLKSKVKNSQILDEVMGSDHAPIKLVLNI